jgi:protein kinase/serine/threonine-protein kinase
LSQENDNFLTNIGFFIASSLLVEILECVEYMHTQVPEILHQNLKPKNILITESSNGRFVKIVDSKKFSTQDFERFSKKSLVKGEIKYIAHEVLNKQPFSIKSDVFSIGVIIEDLFKINIQK